MRLLLAALIGVILGSAVTFLLPRPAAGQPLTGMARLGVLPVEQTPRPALSSRASRGAVRATPTPRPGLHLTPLERRIASCESSPTGYNTDGGPTGVIDWHGHDPRSTASGGYSFLDSTWVWVTGLPAPAAAYPPAVQLAAFRRLRALQGLRPWRASESCWHR